MRIEILPAAQHDIESARDYIYNDNPKAARDLVHAVLNKIDQLLDHPKIGRSGRVKGTRELVVVRTEYIVVYKVVSDDLIVIIRVLHGAQMWP